MAKDNVASRDQVNVGGPWKSDGQADSDCAGTGIADMQCAGSNLAERSPSQTESTRYGGAAEVDRGAVALRLQADQAHTCIDATLRHLHTVSGEADGSTTTADAIAHQ